jgi:hypothetical protein
MRRCVRSRRTAEAASYLKKCNWLFRWWEKGSPFICACMNVCEICPRQCVGRIQRNNAHLSNPRFTGNTKSASNNWGAQNIRGTDTKSILCIGPLDSKLDFLKVSKVSSNLSPDFPPNQNHTIWTICLFFLIDPNLTSSFPRLGPSGSLQTRSNASLVGIAQKLTSERPPHPLRRRFPCPQL